MRKLIERETFCLRGVSEKPDKNGKYQLVFFDGIDIDLYNYIIPENEIDEVIKDLSDAIWEDESKSTISRYEVTDDDCCNGSASIVGSDHFIIYDIRDKVNVDPDDASRFYIVVNVPLKEYHWIVAESQGTIFYDHQIT